MVAPRGLPHRARDSQEQQRERVSERQREIETLNLPVCFISAAFSLRFLCVLRFVPCMVVYE